MNLPSTPASFTGWIAHAEVGSGAEGGQAGGESGPDGPEGPESGGAGSEAVMEAAKVQPHHFGWVVDLVECCLLDFIVGRLSGKCYATARRLRVGLRAYPVVFGIGSWSNWRLVATTETGRMAFRPYAPLATTYPRPFRNRRPGIAPVGSPSSKVISPFTSVQR